jgi:hypothetical protein
LVGATAVEVDQPSEARFRAISRVKASSGHDDQQPCRLEREHARRGGDADRQRGEGPHGARPEGENPDLRAGHDRRGLRRATVAPRWLSGASDHDATSG